MATLPDALAAWKLANPFPQKNGDGTFTTQAEYDAMATERAPLLLEQMNRQEADAARVLLRKKYRAAKTILDTPVGTTAADVRTAVAQHRTILGGLIEVLKDSGLLLDDS